MVISLGEFKFSELLGYRKWVKLEMWKQKGSIFLFNQ